METQTKSEAKAKGLSHYHINDRDLERYIMEKTNERKTNNPIAGYCIGVEGRDRQDCHKIIDGCCSVYADTCRKMGRSQMLGCSFSPFEQAVPQSAAGKKRLGQQKQTKKGKKETGGGFHKKGRKWRT